MLTIPRTYPFSIHDPTFRAQPGYLLISVDPHQSIITVHSSDCVGASTLPSAELISCRS
ncbi:hypothetical protein BXZ70DRAFT_60516 [Cristinia sonorae]|uniref:Uncharacterized protein n=1 Tax=Cristinia sonorae TaxID=1940300 RepID=A0A8K0UR65_9AGAR|nr:hypothetical protein BXZ70DRAFT_60516 [Cristinia sonorae]